MSPNLLKKHGVVSQLQMLKPRLEQRSLAWKQSRPPALLFLTLKYETYTCNAAVVCRNIHFILVTRPENEPLTLKRKRVDGGSTWASVTACGEWQQHVMEQHTHSPTLATRGNIRAANRCVFPFKPLHALMQWPECSSARDPSTVTAGC